MINLAAPRIIRKTLILTLSLIASFAAYSQSGIEEYHEDASRLFYEEDYKSALIQLKNALQINPEHVPSLVLSAQVFMQTDDPEAAEEYLLKARVLGADRDFINITLAQAYRRQGKFRSMIDELSIRNLPPAIAADILGYHAEAWISLGNEPKAQEVIEQAELTSPNRARPAIARVLLAIALKRYDQAIELGTKLTHDHANNSDAWNVYASALHAQGQLSKALTAYSQAISLNPKHLDARMARSGIYLDINDNKKALKDLQYLEEHYPYEPRAAYLRALVYAKLTTEHEDYEQKSITELRVCTEIIAQLPPHKVSADPQLTMVAALAHYGLQEFESSKEYLTLYLARNHRDPGANRLMGDILIKLNDPISAVRFLKPAHDIAPADQRITTLLATAYSQAGHHEKATKLLQSIDQSLQSGGDVNARLAISLMQSKHFTSGVRSLEQVVDHTGNNHPQAGFALALAYLKSKQYPQALIQVEKLTRQSPDNASYQNLLALTQQAVGQPELAKQTLTALITRHPTLTAAHINLAKIEFQQGNTTQAAQRLKSLLAESPENTDLMLAIAKFELSQGNTDAARRLAENARQLDNQDIDIRVFLLDLYIAINAFEDAESLALDTKIMTDDSFESSITLGKVYSRIGKQREAISTYKHMTKQAGFHSERLYTIAQLLIENQAWVTARHALFKALEGNPTHQSAQISYIQVQLQLGESQDALERATTFTEQHPNLAIGYWLAGESLMQLKRFDLAQKTYAKGLQLGFDSSLVIGQSQAFIAQGKTKQSGKLLQSHWNKQRHPLIGAQYSLYLIQQQQWQQAQTIITQLLDISPNEPTHLNNLAHVLDQSGQPQALDYARKAHELAPNNPFINDTLGWLLVKSGNPKEGLKYLRQAVARESGDPELLYHLGKALLELGRENEAKRQLESAVNKGLPFQGKQDALKLLQTLS